MAELDKVASKTTPNLRDETRTDNSEFFEKDYLVQLDNSGKVSGDIKERQHADVRQSAMQRGLRPTGDVELEKTEKVDSRNVRFIYKLPVADAARDDLPAEVEHAHVTEAAQAEAEKE